MGFFNSVINDGLPRNHHKTMGDSLINSNGKIHADDYLNSVKSSESLSGNQLVNDNVSDNLSARGVGLERNFINTNITNNRGVDDKRVQEQGLEEQSGVRVGDPCLDEHLIGGQQGLPSSDGLDIGELLSKSSVVRKGTKGADEVRTEVSKSEFMEEANGKRKFGKIVKSVRDISKVYSDDRKVKLTSILNEERENLLLKESGAVNLRKKPGQRTHPEHSNKNSNVEKVPANQSVIGGALSANNPLLKLDGLQDDLQTAATILESSNAGRHNENSDSQTDLSNKEPQKNIDIVDLIQRNRVNNSAINVVAKKIIDVDDCVQKKFKRLEKEATVQNKHEQTNHDESLLRFDKLNRQETKESRSKTLNSETKRASSYEAPRVHIGHIDVIISAPTSDPDMYANNSVAVNTSASPFGQSSSRKYLRRI